MGNKINGDNTAYFWRSLKMGYWIVLILLGIYQLGRVTLGLAVHPYKTMRQVAREASFWPATLVPMVVLIGVVVSTRVGAAVWEVPVGYRNMVAIGLTVFMVGLGLWQGVVGYLWVRFWRARRGWPAAN